MGAIRLGMLSILLASSGLAAVEGGKSPLCDVDWIEAASLEQIAGQLEAGTTCPLGEYVLWDIPLLVALRSEAGIDKIRLLVANEKVADVAGTWAKLSPLHVAAAFRSLEVVKLLADRGYDINARSLEWSGRSPLHAAAQKNPDAKVIDFLIERGAEINGTDEYGSVPLHLAADHNPRLDVLQALLAHGADPLAKNTPRVGNGRLPFHSALFNNPNMEIVKALYKPDFLDVRIGGVTPLMIAARLGRAEPVEFLIDKGVEIDAQSNIGSTALHFAVASSSIPNTDGDDYLSIVQILLDNGADVSIRNKYFNSALHRAFIGSDLQPDMAVVSALLDHGSDPSDINDVPCIAQINDFEYKIPADLIALLEERGVAKIEPSVIDHLSCFKERALAFVRNFRITNYST